MSQIIILCWEIILRCGILLCFINKIIYLFCVCYMITFFSFMFRIVLGSEALFPRPRLFLFLFFQYSYTLINYDRVRKLNTTILFSNAPNLWMTTSNTTILKLGRFWIKIARHLRITNVNFQSLTQAESCIYECPTTENSEKQIKILKTVRNQNKL